MHVDFMSRLAAQHNRFDQVDDIEDFTARSLAEKTMLNVIGSEKLFDPYMDELKIETRGSGIKTGQTPESLVIHC